MLRESVAKYVDYQKQPAHYCPKCRRLVVRFGAK
jgi:hypothetical protein